MSRLAGLLLVVTLVVGGCAGDGDEDATPPLVATTTHLLAGVVSAIGGDEVEVVSLLPPGADPERDAGTDLSGLPRLPELVVSVGLGFEAGMDPVLREARERGIPVVELTAAVEVAPAADGSTPDPRVWLDPLRLAAAAPVVARWLTGIAPELGVESWQSRGRAYADEVRALHDQVGAILSDTSEIPRGSPGLHYLAGRYGLGPDEPPLGRVVVDATDRDPPDPDPAAGRLLIPLDDLGNAAGYADFIRSVARAVVDATG